MPASDATRRKALTILREGRCTVLVARSDEQLQVTAAVVRVQGNRGVYVVDLRAGAWTCTCDRSFAGVRCGHIVAAQLITGHAANGAAA